MVGKLMQVCPVCESPNIYCFMNGIFDSESTNVMECRNCGTQFLDPLMAVQEEEDYYAGYYLKQKIRHFKAMDLIDLQERAFTHYKQYRSVYLELISECRSVLEIGSGSGGFLRFLREYCPHIKVAAVERDGENVSFLRQCFGDGATVVVDNLEALLGEKFDCVVAFGVFEHLRDSRGFLRDIKKYLHNDGTLALNVPNKAYALVYAYGLDEFKKFAYMKQHYYTFTEEAFELLAAQTGFVIDRFNYIQVWGLDNHLSWLRYRKPRDYSDFTSILSQQTFDSYNNDLIEKKITDVMMAVLTLDGGKAIAP